MSFLFILFVWACKPHSNYYSPHMLLPWNIHDSARAEQAVIMAEQVAAANY